MAITRRQFVTRLGTLAAAAGFSQADVARIAEAFAYGTTAGKTNLGGTLGKPRVIWIHGAECTGCSTSLLSIFEDTDGTAIVGTSTTTGAAAGLAKILPTELTGMNFTFHATGNNVEGSGSFAAFTPYGRAMNIADVVVDVVDLQYHETVMGMGGDLAAQWLEDFRKYTPVPAGTAPGDYPFVLVVEGALQPSDEGGAWSDTSDTSIPWCSIGMSDDWDHSAPPVGSFEHDMHEVVYDLAIKDTCAAIIPIGQCATFGGYPGAKSGLATGAAGDFDRSLSQTNAMGVYEYLSTYRTEVAAHDAAAKVINVPGCPTNPWWFVLTVVCFLVDLVNPSRPLGVLTPAGAPNGDAIDNTRRLKKVYGTPIHGPYCPRYQDYVNNDFAALPGDPGCLQKIGCKGPATNSLCGMHGWNNQQPENDATWNYGVPAANGVRGGHCTRAGHPCMACTEKGYPDSFVPFVVRS